MEPLKSRKRATSPIELRAIALLRSVQPHQPPAGQKQRVRMRLVETPHLHHHFGHALRPALILGAILIAAGASAAIGGKWLSSRGFVGSTQHSARLQPASASVGNVTRNFRPEPAAAPESAPPALSADTANDNTSSKPAASVQSANGQAEGAPGRLDVTARTAATSEKGLVFDAMRALRREGHPERAARLLDEYLHRYPRGSLCEEALALSIEANTALGGAKTKALADRYLATYPEGRFRAAALRARARFSQ